MISMNRTDLFWTVKKAHDEKEAPPDKVGALYHLLPIEFHDFTGRIDFLRLSLFGSWYYLNFFRDGMGPFMDS